MPAKPKLKPKPTSTKHTAESVVATLRRLATKATLDGMARYAIPSHNALGVSVSDMQKQAKLIGKNHELAEALWQTNIYEGRMMSSFLDEPEKVTPTQMDRWCNDFDSWAICDTVCFHLFDRVPHAYKKVAQWRKKKEEFVKRGAFALLACLALHDKEADDGQFVEFLKYIEEAASDERNFVKKAVNWALRAIGCRNASMKAAAIEVASRLAASTNATERWVGKDALRQLAKRKQK